MTSLPRLVAPVAVAVVVLAILTAIAAGPIFLIPWVLAALLWVGFVAVARGGARGRSGRDGSRSSDGAIPNQGFDRSTPLGDTDQHASERTTGRPEGLARDGG